VVGAVATRRDEAERNVTFTYQVEGSADSVDVSYTGADNNEVREEDVSLPWSKDVTITIEGAFTFVSLSATNLSSGRITCRILADGKEVHEASSEGPIGIASCLGNAQPG
jgi:Mycobacterium membrane protein